MTKRTRILFYLSLSLNIAIFTLIIFVKIGGLQYLVGIKDYITHNKKILFLGDSLTEQARWDDLYSNVIVDNFAKGANTTDTLLNTVDLNFANHANKIFLMVGVDDLGEGKTPDETIRNYAALLKKLGKNRKKVIIESVLPINEGMKNNNYPNFKATSGDIVKLDSLLKNLCFNYQIPYIDIYPHMVNAKNQLNPNFTFDGVHLNSNGYATWKSVLKSTVTEREVTQ